MVSFDWQGEWMSSLKVSDNLARIIEDEAKARGQAVEEYLRAIVQRERTLSDRARIEKEQEWWLNRPPDERASYRGEYIAVLDQNLVDHDKDKQALFRRVRNRYGRTAVLVMPAEGPSEIGIVSPRLLSE